MSDISAQGTFDSTEIAEGESPSGGLRTSLGRFYFHGKPIYLIQTGTYGLRTDRGYDGTDPHFWRGLVDRLAALQQDGIRFRIRIDPWAFCYDPDALSPWSVRDGGWTLEQFDQGFWTVLQGAAEYAHSREVLVELVLFNAATLRMGRGGTGWPRNPFNAANGGPLTRDPAAQFYNLPHPLKFDVSSQSLIAPLQAAQESLIREATGRLQGLDNVSWEIASQLEAADPSRIAFIGHFVELLRRVDSLDRVVTASVRTLRRADQELYRQVGIDTVQVWLPSGLEPHEELIESVSALRSYAKPIVVGEANWEADEPISSVRRALWQTYVAGGHACAYGLLEQNDPALAAFLEFVAHTAARAVTPDWKLVTSRTEGLHCHGGHAGDNRFVLYATAESAASAVEASLRLAPGRWKATSVSPATGEVLTEQTLEAMAPATRLVLPPFAEDLAVRLVRVD